MKEVGINEINVPSVLEPKVIEKVEEGILYLTESIIAATISNFTAAVSGHPLDTIRVRMQMDPRDISMV